jgi:MFS family permease
MLLLGLMLAYWINYGFYFHEGSIQWRFPLLFQIVFAVYVIVITAFLPDTPRWLMLHESTPDRGLLVLSRLRSRPISDPVVQKEKEEILAAINLETNEEGTWMDLFRDGGCAANKRFYLALGAQFMQQTSGKF